MSSLLVRRGPRRDDPHEAVYFRRHPDDDLAAGAPGREFLRSCPTGVRAKFVAILVAVAAAPPHRFAGGRHHYRLFCQIDVDADGFDRPLLVVIAGLDKPFRTTLAARDYAGVRALGAEYRARNPRSLT